MLFLFLMLSPHREELTMLIGEHSNDLYNFAYRLTLNKHDADDLFQQTWIKVVANYGKFNGENFKAWIYKICSNQFKDNYRKAKSYKKIVKDDYSDNTIKDYVINEAKSTDDTFKQVQDLEQKQWLLDKIYSLPEKKREPLLMYYYKAMKYDEIASELSIPIGTVRSRISDAKKMLKKQLEGESYV